MTWRWDQALKSRVPIAIGRSAGVLFLCNIKSPDAICLTHKSRRAFRTVDLPRRSNGWALIAAPRSNRDRKAFCLPPDSILVVDLSRRSNGQRLIANPFPIAIAKPNGAAPIEIPRLHPSRPSVARSNGYRTITSSSRHPPSLPLIESEPLI